MTCRNNNKSTAEAAIRLATFCLLWTAHLVAQGPAVSIDNDRFTSPLIVRVYGVASLSPGMLDASENQADQILRVLPFRFRWLNCDSQTAKAECRAEVAPTELLVRVLNKALPQARAGALGIACSRHGEGVAFIFYDRMIALRTQGRSLPSIMGRVLAHELVHVLLPGERHSTLGLMRGQWSTDDLGTDTSTWMGLPVASVRLLEKEARRRLAAVNNLDAVAGLH